MRQRPRKVARTSLLALALANPMRSLLLTSLGPSKSALLPRSHTHTTPRALATTARKRARPAWGSQSRRLGPSVAGFSSRAGGVVGRNGLHVSETAAMKSSVSCAAAGTRVPLTHEQLPDETIYLLDGTSMLFRAFYGRGAGG